MSTGARGIFLSIVGKSMCVFVCVCVCVYVCVCGGGNETIAVGHHLPHHLLNQRQNNIS